jgi:hypothetical protein
MSLIFVKTMKRLAEQKMIFFGSHSIILSQAEVLHRQRRLKRRAEFLRRKQQKFMLFQNIKRLVYRKKYFGINSIDLGAQTPS